MVRSCAALLCLSLAGCTLGPDFVHPEAPLGLSWLAARPASTAPSQPIAAPLDPQWWSIFGDPVLTRLANRVADENLDVQTATLRLAESRAQRGIAAADEFPKLNGNVSYTREQQSSKGVVGLIGGGASGSSPATQSNGLGGRQSGIPVGISQPFDLFQHGFDASWELDLWGRVRRSVESADASVDASADARRDTFVSTVAELARDYLQLRGTQESLRIVAANLATAQETARLTRSRAAGGQATDLDVDNAEAQVNQTESQSPGLEQQAAALINAIGFLLGQAPGTLRADLTPAASPRPPPTVPVGLPSELARRRPDLRRAEAQLHAATADIGVAVADFYPRVTLSGSVALQALQFKDIGSLAARTYGLGPSVSIPIFDGGRLRSTLELRKAEQREAAVTFQRTVLQAWREIDDAVAAYDAEQRRRDRIAAQAGRAGRALDVALRRYRGGLGDYLGVLTAQRTLLAAQDTLASSTATVNTDLVALYKALGGGWETSFPQAEPSFAAVTDTNQGERR